MKFASDQLTTCSSAQFTALHRAACESRTEACQLLKVCQLLIAAKADVKAHDGCAYVQNLLLIVCCIVFLKFGSDLPFFIIGKPAFVFGRGQEIVSLAKPLPKLLILLI